MRAIIGPNLLSSKVAQPTKKPFEVYDSRLPGFTLRVQPSGVRSYYARFGRNRRITLGKADTLLPDEARERDVRRCSAMWRTGAIRCTASEALTVSRLESSSLTRT